MFGAVRNLFLSLVLVGLVTAEGSAAVIVGYESLNPVGPVTASQVAGGVTALELSRGPGVTRASGATFNTRDWTEGVTIDPDDYLQWGWSNSLVPFNLQSLDLRYDRSSSGPAQLEIQLSVDGGAYETVHCDADVSGSGEEHLGIDLTAFEGVNSANFRLYAYNSDRASGTFDLENFGDSSQAIVVHGTATAVPEPSAWSLLCSLGLSTIALRASRRVRWQQHSHCRSPLGFVKRTVRWTLALARSAVS